ncbi:helix-hairpin-helix domain-containing protein [Halovivax cerinus]|uniref:Helix-hairpin-helix domain-containing protein n=1 Tax=Halovivax cerinus TaxID=1487865 RepID=A0ABD5NPL0_9EURY|nr:helix-hairpin-helix domain-containing protein [Halovivax cerinus]
MTELTRFLAALYDSFSEAEMQAQEHGRRRYLELLETGAIPKDGAVPVYHAADASVTLDVGLAAEETKHGTEIYITEPTEGDESGLTFTVELFDLVDIDDFENLEYEDVLDDGVPPGRSRPGGPGGGPIGDIESQSVDAVRGIGPEFSNDLEAAGVESIADLVVHSPEELAEIVSEEGGVVSPDRASDWIEQARGMIAVLSGGAQPVEFVDDIGPAYGSRLREHGIETLSELVDRSPDEVADLVSTASRSISTDRTGEWLAAAEDLLAELEQTEADVAERSSDEPGESDASPPTDDSAMTSAERESTDETGMIDETETTGDPETNDDAETIGETETTDDEER